MNIHDIDNSPFFDKPRRPYGSAKAEREARARPKPATLISLTIGLDEEEARQMFYRMHKHNPTEYRTVVFLVEFWDNHKGGKVWRKKDYTLAFSGPLPSPKRVLDYHNELLGGYGARYPGS